MSAKLILDFVAATARDHHRAIRGEAMPPARERQLRAAVRPLLADRRNYCRYTVANGAVSDLMITWPVPMCGRKDALDSISLFAPGADVVREVAAARAHFPAKTPRPIFVSLLPSQLAFRRTLERQGFELDSCVLVGKVADGLRHARKRLKSVDRSGLTLSRMDLKKDLAAVLRLEKICHAAEPSSRAHGLPHAAVREDMTFYLTRACADAPNHVLLMRHGKTLVGLVVGSAPPKRADGLLGAIAIHPDFQGRGLAHWLYHEALAAMDAAGVRWYRGYSSTDAVLGLAKAMRRQVGEVLLRDGFT